MKRLIGGLLAVIIGPIIMSTTSLAASTDFTYKSLTADYSLGADKQGRSTLKVVETLVAEFPASGQSYTVDRTLPTTYDGHPTNFQLVSVTDQTGAGLNYDLTDQSDGKLLSITTTASGEHTYVITYTEHDVTKYVASVPGDQFTWDVSGGKLQQPVGSASVTVHADSNVSPTLDKKVTCTQSLNNQTQNCTITEQGSTITASAANLQAGADMAIMVGFTPGTFRAYEPPVAKPTTLVAIGAVVLVMVVFGLSVRYKQRHR